MKYFSILFFALFIFSCSKDGSGSSGGAWLQQVGGERDDRFYDVVQDSKGDFVACGDLEKSVKGYSSRKETSYLVKFDADGDVIWERNIFPDTASTVYAMHEIVGEGYFLAGTADEIYGMLLKVDYNGTNPKVGFTANSIEDAVIDSNGDFIVVGEDLEKYDKNFNLIWNNPQYGYAVDVADDNSLYTISFGNNTEKITVHKFSSLGETLWSKTYSFGGEVYLSDNQKYQADIKVLSNGDLAISAGLRRDNIDNFEKYLCIRLNASGDILWSSLAGGEQYNRASCIAELPNGNLIVGGVSNSDLDGTAIANENYTLGWVVEFDSIGETQRSYIIDGDDKENIYGIIPLNNDEFIMVGETESSESPFKESLGFQDAFIAKGELK